ncbi:MAG: twin-arginine translocase TatA/TatE family subunit [Chloroflexi bacterium]|nr:twin-arginine translocase TatA/TatE family subunit [Chloroflexota bacterium]MBT17750.1 twin-arginine translocase TatA/TatE family subunit [Dehalococcoidia bacterium]|tara:strand:+ start:1550 stop:1750 length:201 start_codon:yes stop_codon:yes gene_type:complete
MPFGIGWPELTIILVIVLVIFGASRVPEVGGAIGRGIREFRKSVNTDESIEKEKESTEVSAKKKKD